jgi:hypothetical protein
MLRKQQIWYSCRGAGMRLQKVSRTAWTSNRLLAESPER